MTAFNIFRKFMMVAAATFAVGAFSASDAAAEIFISRSDNKSSGKSNTPSIILNTQKKDGSTGGNGIYLNTQKNTATGANRPRGYNANNNELKQGTAYSVAEYNRRVAAQRQAEQNKAARATQKSTVYPAGYGQSSNDQYVVDSGTGRMMRKSEADALQKKRDQYLKNNKFASAGPRTASEEAFFATNGYYPSDAGKPAGNDAKVGNTFGTKLDYTPPVRRDKYGALADRYRSFQGSSDR